MGKNIQEMEFVEFFAHFSLYIEQEYNQIEPKKQTAQPKAVFNHELMAQYGLTESEVLAVGR